VHVYAITKSIKRESLWNNAAKYGIPDKIINITKRFYHGRRWAVKVDEVLSEFFEIHSGKVAFDRHFFLA